MPLAWMIGAMLATTVASLVRVPVRLPRSAQQIVRTLVGTMLGAAITLQLVQSSPDWWPSLLCLLLALALMFVVGYVALRRIGGFEKPSAVLCAIPGGIAEMILLADKAGANETRVSIVHALRIALTILVMPFLLGWFGWDGERPARPADVVAFQYIDWFWMAICVASGLLAHRFTRLPAPLVFVPMCVGGLLHLSGIATFGMPNFVTVLVQIFIGIYVGSRFSGTTPAALARAIGLAVTVVAIQIAVASGVAMLIVMMTGWEPLALLLAYAPGGLAEMSLIAVAVNTDPSFVGLHHMFRVLVALMVAPLLLSFLTEQRDKR